MSDFQVQIESRLRSYLLANGPPEHPQLQKLREHTSMLPKGHMQIRPEQGQLLTFLIRLAGARLVLELGTFTGYSALTIALAVPKSGKVVTCEMHGEWVNIGRPFWEKAGVSNKIDVMLGPATTSLKKLEEHNSVFDLIFIDADKRNYGIYYESALRLVRVGGLIVLDNTLQHGNVADPSDDHPRTLSMRNLNRKIASDDRVDDVIIPLADGMTLACRRL